MLNCRLLIHNIVIRNLRTSITSLTINSVENDKLSIKNHLHMEQIATAIERTPELKNYKIDLWHKIHDVFINQGFNTIGFLKIITTYPTILYFKPNDIITRIECWRNTQLGEKNLHQLFEDCPKFLEFSDIRHIRERFGYLMEFVGNQNNICKLLKMSPNLLVDNSKIISEKFTYLKDIMKIDISEIVRSGTLSHSMDKIKCRHEFVERLGLFKAKFKANPLEQSSNPKLYQIMDTSDKKFATKLCHVTLEEYETFEELFKRELTKNVLKHNFNDHDYQDYEEIDDDVTNSKYKR